MVDIEVGRENVGGWTCNKVRSNGWFWCQECPTFAIQGWPTYLCIIYRHSQQSDDGASIDLDNMPAVLQNWVWRGRKGRDLFKVLCWHFLAGAEENHERFLSLLSVSWPRFEAENSGMKIRGVRFYF